MGLNNLCKAGCGGGLWRWKGGGANCSGGCVTCHGPGCLPPAKQWELEGEVEGVRVRPAASTAASTPEIQAGEP